MIISAPPPSSSLQLKTGLFASSPPLVYLPLSFQSARSLSVKPVRFRRFSRLTRQSSSGDGFGSGKNDSKSVLDAFFLGKALVEAVTERVESTIGEFVSELGRFQAEQQKQVQDLQDEVFERAKRAKEKAALQAMEEERLTTKPVLSSVPSKEKGTPNASPQSSKPPIDGGLYEMMKD